MNCNRTKTQYYVQLENGIAEMEATIERLRTEIHKLTEKRNALTVLIDVLKRRTRGQVPCPTYLPKGEHADLFKRREVGQGYTLIGTHYKYNKRNQLIHRSNEVRYEAYDYTYDGEGNLLSDGRSKYEWNDRGQLTKVTFPDGSPHHDKKINKTLQVG